MLVSDHHRTLHHNLWTPVTPEVPLLLLSIRVKGERKRKEIIGRDRGRVLPASHLPYETRECNTAISHPYPGRVWSYPATALIGSSMKRLARFKLSMNESSNKALPPKTFHIF